MLIKLVGYAHKEGRFKNDEGETIEFNNIVLDLLTDTPMDGEHIKAQAGLHCSSLKIKHEQLRTLFPPEVKTLNDLDSWINHEITLDFSLLGSKPTLCGINKKAGK